MLQNSGKHMTRREYFYTIDTRGNLIHDGAIIDDPVFLDFFFKRVRANDSGLHPDYKFYAPCGPEWNFIACADTPLVFQQLIDGQLKYAPNYSVKFQPEHLAFAENGVLYHRSPVGQWGRVHPTVAVELAKNIHLWGPWFRYRDTHSLYDTIITPREIPSHLQLLAPRENNACFGCGQAAEIGLRLSFLFDKNASTVETWFVPDARLMGSLNIMHGGFVALLLDETMGKILGALGTKAPTAQLNVRYRKPVPIGEELYLKAEIIKREGRKNELRGSIMLARDSDTVLAEAQALFITLRQTMQSLAQTS